MSFNVVATGPTTKNAKAVKPIPKPKDKPCHCVICEKVIKDSEGKSKGQDSIFCEGSCQGWLHRTCACIPKPVFQALTTDPDKPYYCPNCKCNKQEAELTELKQELASLKSLVTNLQSSVALTSSLEASPANAASQSSGPNQTTFAATVGENLHVQKPASNHRTSEINNYERKFNIVLYGIEEAPKGSNRLVRSTHDDEEITSTLSVVDESFTHQSIRDSFRLGRYDENKKRPILVKFSRFSDASSVLSKRRNLATLEGIRIQPDLSPQDRITLSVLLKERRKLIDQDSVDRQQIRIRGNSIYVNGKKHGNADGSSFSPVNSPPQHQTTSTSGNPEKTTDDPAQTTSSTTVQASPNNCTQTAPQ